MTFVAALMTFPGQCDCGCPCTSAVLDSSLHLVTGLTEGAGEGNGSGLKTHPLFLSFCNSMDGTGEHYAK